MEGKAVLFKRFADIDAIDTEIDTEDPKNSSTRYGFSARPFGGINLEDIKAPECFIIEARLRELIESSRSFMMTHTEQPSSPRPA